MFRTTSVCSVILFWMPLLAWNAWEVTSFSATPTSNGGRGGGGSSARTETHFAPTAPDRVRVLSDATAVGAEVRQMVETAAAQAIAARGHFYLAIPGGSILKMLAGCGAGAGGGGDDEDDEDSTNAWTRFTTLAYVNHKCVSMEDTALATHAKARQLFLDDWPGCHAIVLDGTADGPAEAAAYQQKLEQLANLPRNEDGFPVFDLALIGVGDDGHVGSLYPNREEVLDTQAWVLPVTLKDPPSITLSLPVMTAAQQVVVAACGVSDKYPQGKSDAMRRAIVDTTETLTTFPAVGLRDKATWVLDEAAASKLGVEYNR